MSWAVDGETPKPKTREELLAAIPDNVRSAALAWLQSPVLMSFIAESIELCGVAGEQQTAMLVYLTGTSRLLEHPLAVIVQGPSSSGKSYVIDSVARLFPTEVILKATDMTDQALYYMERGSLSHRWIVAGERARGLREETGQGTKALREMISAGVLSKAVTISTPDGPETKFIEQPGPIAYAESTTATDLFEEDANRCLILPSDERPEQTREILRAHGQRSAGITSAAEQVTRRELLRALHLLLEPVPVIVPYAVPLAELFPCERVEARRAFGHLEAVIHTLALLHQAQRPRDDLGRLIAQADDYAIARQLLEPIFARSLGSRDADSLRRFVEQLQRLSGEFAAKQPEVETMRKSPSGG